MSNAIETAPDLSARVERSIISVFKDAFPAVAIGSASDPAKRGESSIGVKADQQGENPQGTNIHDVEIGIEARNLDHPTRELLRQMVGTSRSAYNTITERGAKQFSLPAGDPVEVNGPIQSAEDQDERVITYTLTASIQPT